MTTVTAGRMTSVNQHYSAPANDAELLGAAHTWRGVRRQATTDVAALADHASDPPIRRAR